MRQRTQERLLKTILIILTLGMIVLRFLLNENGRVTPDSIRFMRQARVFPIIDNTTAPLLYPISLKLFSVFGGEFWASKIVGILSYLFIVIFAWKKKFYFKESILVGGLFSFVSLYAATLSEALFFPFAFLFFYVARKIILEEYSKIIAIFLLSLILILLFNVRYIGLFYMGGTFVFGLLNFKKSFAKIYIIASTLALLYVVGYKLLFIDTFNQNYVNQFLEIGLKPTLQLIKEFSTAIATSFNPFIHILAPSGGIINIGIIGIGIINIALLSILVIKNGLSATEKLVLFFSVFGLLCSFFIQYFYQTDALDYRLLAPFTFGIWLIYFKKLHQIFGKWVYGITLLSIVTGFTFSYLSRGNYLENRNAAKAYLTKKQLIDKKVYYYYNAKEDINYNNIQIAELLSTINPRIYVVTKGEDTLKNEVLTHYKVESNIKINKNKFQ